MIRATIRNRTLATTHPIVEEMIRRLAGTGAVSADLYLRELIEAAWLEAGKPAIDAWLRGADIDALVVRWLARHRTGQEPICAATAYRAVDTSEDAY